MPCQQPPTEMHGLPEKRLWTNIPQTRKKKQAYPLKLFTEKLNFHLKVFTGKLNENNLSQCRAILEGVLYVLGPFEVAV